MRRLVALVLVAAVAGTLPADAGARKHRHRHRAGKLTGKQGRVHVPARWDLARRRRPVRPVAQPSIPVPVKPPVPVATPAPPVVSPAPTPTPSTVPSANPRSVSVRATEYAFTLSQASVLAGDVRVQFDNSRAEDPHELSLFGDETGDYWTTGVQDAGSVTARTYKMRPGVYTLFCPLPQHEALGMRAKLTVR